MDPIVKGFLNSRRCPICKSQIYFYSGREFKGNNFGCVNRPTHFSFLYITDDGQYRMEREDVQVYSGKFLYQVRQYHWTGKPPVVKKKEETIIYIKKVDKELQVIEKSKVERFQYDKLLFDFQSTDESKIIHRVRTILVFQ